MRQDIRLGRVAGVAVGANWTVGVILVLIGWLLGASVLPGAVPHQAHGLYWSAAVAGAVLFLASLLAHETAHAVVARRNGVRVRSITLWMLGGIAELEGEPPDAGADLRIALAGPATSTLAAGVFLGAAALPGAVGAAAVAVAAAQWLAVMNGLLAAFNLLPGAPLDGGRALRALLWRHYGDRRRAEATAARAGQFLGAAVTAFGVFELLAWRSFGGLWLVLAGWFLLAAASTEQQAAVAAAALAGVRIADIQTADPGLAPGWSTGCGAGSTAPAGSSSACLTPSGYGCCATLLPLTSSGTRSEPSSTRSDGSFRQPPTTSHRRTSRPCAAS